MARAVLLALLFAAGAARGQAPLGAWASYTGTFRSAGVPVGLLADAQLRGHRVTSDLDQLALRVGVQAVLPHRVTLTQGYAFIHAGPAGPGGEGTAEHRLFQDAGGSRSVSRVRLAGRARFEERWVEGQPFQTRLRTQLAATVPLRGDAVRRGSVYAAATAELFLRGPVRGERPVYDRTRLYGGVGVRATGALGVQAGVVAQVVDGPTDWQVVLSAHHAVTF